jgi:hypothetical protein
MWRILKLWFEWALAQTIAFSWQLWIAIWTFAIQTTNYLIIPNFIGQQVSTLGLTIPNS